jgi:Tol biopolymer transport system component
VLPLFGERKPFPFVQSPFVEDWAEFSPDGRWVAYESNESGRSEVYVSPFPGPGGKWQVSTAGGIEPRWRHDGKEIFFLAAAANSGYGRDAGKLMAAAVRADGSRLEIGAVQSLFDVRTPVGKQRVYDVTADGRFLIDTVEEQSPLTIVVNWPSLLRK